MSVEHIRTKIDEASEGFAKSADQYKEVRENNKGPEIFAEAQDIFRKIMGLAGVLRADHLEALEALESGIAHTRTAFAAMQDTGDFIKPGDDASMITYSQRALREAGEAKQKTQTSLSKYDNELSTVARRQGMRLMDEQGETLGLAAGFLDEIIERHDDVLTALTEYKSQL